MRRRSPSDKATSIKVIVWVLPWRVARCQQVISINSWQTINNPLALYPILTPICFVILLFSYSRWCYCSLSPLFFSRVQEAPVDAEVAVTPKNVRKRKTTHSDLTHGSFFLRVGAIGKQSTELSMCPNYSHYFSLPCYYFPPFPVLLTLLSPP